MSSAIEPLEKEKLKEKDKGKKKEKSKDKEHGMDLLPVKGTRDFPPDEMRLRSWLFQTFREVSQQFGLEEYDAPMLEHTELYERKQGEEITKQLYCFEYTEDENVSRVALRPEMTPSLARLILQRGKSLLLPIKWFAIPQCWRFEAVQKGRRREHFQWNVDIVGVKGVGAEVEIICALITSFERFGLSPENVGVRINNRKILFAILEAARVHEEQQQAVCIAIDKLDKTSREEVMGTLMQDPINLEPLAADFILDCVAEKDITALRNKFEANNKDVQAAFDEVHTLFETIKAYGFGDYLQFDASVVRGLAYYTGIVFEAFDRLGKDKTPLFRAIAGGGRYNKLMTLFGSKQEIPACGFGFGDCVIVEVLAHMKKIPKLQYEVEVLIIPFNDSCRKASMTVLRRLRDAGVTCDVVMEHKDAKWAFSYADRRNARIAVFVAPDELQDESVRVKALRGHERNDQDRGTVVRILEIAEFILQTRPRDEKKQ